MRGDTWRDVSIKGDKPYREGGTKPSFAHVTGGGTIASVELGRAR